MYTLGDCLGLFVRDLNHARVIADIESANIAKMYSDHNLLKHFSIPRMKIQDTEFTIPVAIDQLEKYREEEYEPIDKAVLLDNISKVTYSFKISDEEEKRFMRSMLENIKDIFSSEVASFEKELEDGVEIKTSLLNFCTRTVDKSKGWIKRQQIGKKILNNTLEHLKLKEEEFRNKLIEELNNSLKWEIKLKGIKGKIENAIVTVETDKLREKKPESLLYIKMKITEESMEWQVMEDADGNVRRKLMAE